MLKFRELGCLVLCLAIIHPLAYLFKSHIFDKGCISPHEKKSIENEWAVLSLFLNMLINYRLSLLTLRFTGKELSGPCSTQTHTDEYVP